MKTPGGSRFSFDSTPGGSRSRVRYAPVGPGRRGLLALWLLGWSAGVLALGLASVWTWQRGDPAPLRWTLSALLALWTAIGQGAWTLAGLVLAGEESLEIDGSELRLTQGRGRWTGPRRWTLREPAPLSLAARTWRLRRWRPQRDRPALLLRVGWRRLGLGYGMTEAQAGAWMRALLQRHPGLFIRG